MLKGVSRNVIVVRTDRGSRFEAIYFIVKKGAGNDRSDILREANRIVNQSGIPERRGTFAIRFKFIGLGALVGAACASIAWFMIVFLF